VDNSVEYLTPVIHGFEGVAMYSFGGAAGQFATKRVSSVGGSYQYGGLTAAGAYFSGNDPTGATDSVVARAYTAGVNYRWSKFKFALDFANFKNPAKQTSDNYYTGEIAYAPTPSWLLSATFIRQADRVTSKRNASLFKVGADYLISKRTSLYALAGYVRNNSLSSLGLQNSTPAGVVGKNQLGLGLGIRHSF
jgi:predicted porin